MRRREGKEKREKRKGIVISSCDETIKRLAHRELISEHEKKYPAFIFSGVYYNISD